MATNNEKPTLKPPFEVEFPDDGVDWQAPHSQRLYELGQSGLSGVSRPKDSHPDISALSITPPPEAPEGPGGQLVLIPDIPSVPERPSGK